MNAYNILKEKLIFYRKPIIEREFLQQIIDVRTPGYSIAEMCKRKLITVLKKGSLYINGESRDFVNPYSIGKLYCGEKAYCYGGLKTYNMYGFTTQIANEYTLYTSHYLGIYILNNQQYKFKKIRASFFRGMQEMNIGENSISIMTPERALLQMLIDKNSLEFLREKPVNISHTTLEMLAVTYCSKSVLSRLYTLLGQRK